MRSMLVATKSCSAGESDDQLAGSTIAPSPSDARPWLIASRDASSHRDDMSTTLPEQ